MQIPLRRSASGTPIPLLPAKLDRLFERIVSCDVTIEAPHRRQHKSKLYKVRIDIGMPGKVVHVN